MDIIYLLDFTIPEYEACYLRPRPLPKLRPPLPKLREGVLMRSPPPLPKERDGETPELPKFRLGREGLRKLFDGRRPLFLDGANCLRLGA